VREVVPAVGGKDYVPGEHGYRALRPTFIHENIFACRNERLAYLAVHNHDCDDLVDFSGTDVESHERGYPALLGIGKGVPVGALVYGRRAVEADIWMPGGERLSLKEYRVIGSGIRRLYASPPTRAPNANRRTDRQARMFGAAGQSLLAEAKIAIIGLGGVGSLLSEYASRLGIGHLVLVDPDIIEDTNLSRVVGASMPDVVAKLPKTAIAARVAREAQPAIRITELRRDVAERSVADALKTCDYIFLAADSMRSRLVVNAITHQYFVPVVQLGAKVVPATDGSLQDCMAAIRHISPGSGCLWCNGFIDAGQLAIESKTDEDRKAQAYGTNEPNPSVITMNAVAAAHGINDFLFDFLGLRPREREAEYRHEHFLADRTERVIPRRTEDCTECVRRLGLGDGMELPSIPDTVPTVPHGSAWRRAVKSVRKLLG
jgi:molybdopterin/thiamine biosynthesis adenylyltransferase